MTDPHPRAPLHVVLDNIRSAYNVGSAFRTADACGIEHLHLCGMCAHPPHVKLKKTALGADETVPWSYHERTTRCIDDIQARGIPVIAVEVTESAVPYTAFEWPQPSAVLFGNEVHGVRGKIIERCGAVVTIPMFGHKNSLNVATAFGIVLYEIMRQWGRLG